MIEDEVALAQPLIKILESHQIQCDWVADGEQGIDYALTEIYDVILLDIMLPKVDGLQVLSVLRKSGLSTPILMLTALGEISHRVKGLDSGADDYLSKPFSTEELLARIRALGRRKDKVLLEEVIAGSNTVFFPTLATLKTQEKSTELSLKEVSVLQVLVENAPAIVSKDLLLDKVWGFDDIVDPNTVEAYISFLRRKLAYIESSLSIVTVRGMGYRLEVQDVS